jgi:ion channel POLLUX/CASTOR
MKKPTLGQKLRYRFDNTFAAGPIAMISWLGILSLILVIIGGVVIFSFAIAPEGEENLSFIEGVWRSMMRTLDAGTMGGDSGWGFRIVMLGVTIGGVFIVSALIGVLSSGIENKLDQLRKGHSFVVEKNHTLILGWSSKIFTIISELIIANENQRKPRIVVLSEKDKVEMEDEIRSRIGNFKNTKIICRSGNPNDLTDLDIANPYEAKSIIVLGRDNMNNDTQTIKTILALTNNPKRPNIKYHIITEISDPKNIEVAKMVGKDEVTIIVTHDIISRIMVQTCRQSGLSVVYQELMDFDGDEIYFQEEEKLIGKSFGESLFAYSDSAVIGLKMANGTTKINPPMDTLIGKGDSIIAITKDDDTLIIKNDTTINIHEMAITKEDREEKPTPENTLLLGWNNRALLIIRELNNYVAPGSKLKIACHYFDPKEDIENASNSFGNLSISYVNADISDRKSLDALNIESYNHVILLSYEENLDIQEADAQTLITLLHIREISEEKGFDNNVVSQMLDARNRDLAAVTKADDFIVSDKLISLLMSQISENKNLDLVFQELFDAEGSEIYLRPIESYITPGQSINFYTLLEAAKRKNQIAIGYRIFASKDDPESAYGIVINPAKQDSVTFCAKDKLIVISED